MTLPTRTGWATGNTQNAVNSAATVTPAATIPDGSWMLMAIVSATTTFTPSAPTIAGWTELVARTTMGTRSFWLYGRVASSEPANYACALSGTTATRYTIMWGTGADPTIANWQIGATKLRNTIAADDVSNIAPTITTTSGDTLVLAFSAEATNATEAAITSVTGATEWFFTPQAVASSLIEGLSVSYIDKVTAGATGDVTVVYPNIQSANGLAVQVGLPPASPPPPTPVLHYNIVGASTEDGFTVAARTEDVTTGARIKVSTTSDLLTSPSFSSSVLPDADGYVKMTITGLSADTKYYWGTELDGTLDTTMQGSARTLPDVGSQASFVFASSSCHDWDESPAFDAMRTRLDSLNASFFVMLGDLGYPYISTGPTPIAPEDVAQLRLDRELYLEAPDPMEFYRTIATHYTYSDCDGAGSNSDGTWPAFVSGDVQAAYRQQIPNPTLPLADSQARSWIAGRVRFIQTDERTMSSARGATDDSSKSKLGTAQKTWFKTQIDDAAAAGQVVVWCGDGPWVGTASVGGTLDEWRAYNTERVELGNYIAASGVRIIRIHGDTHTLAADDGTNNAYGGFPFISAAPFSGTAFPWGLAASNGSWPAVSAAGRQYGEYTVTDSGDSVTLALSGRAWDGAAYVERVAMSVVWDMDVQPYIVRIYIGDTEVTTAYYGDTLIYEQ